MKRELMEALLLAGQGLENREPRAALRAWQQRKAEGEADDPIVADFLRTLRAWILFKNLEALNVLLEEMDIETMPRTAAMHLLIATSNKGVLLYGARPFGPDAFPARQAFEARTRAWLIANNRTETVADRMLAGFR